jgi:hypothetical protein
MTAGTAHKIHCELLDKVTEENHEQFAHKIVEV